MDYFTSNFDSHFEIFFVTVLRFFEQHDSIELKIGLTISLDL